MDIVSHNRKAWNRQSRGDSRWCQPVETDAIERARQGHWKVILTPNKAVPREWFGDLAGKRLLCLASGGGQQAPILAAAGASVISFDNSDEQLDKDRLVAKRDDLDLRTVQGDMADLSDFEDESFDLIFHPVSNVFAQSIRPVWNECGRVLKSGGRLLAGFMNPAFFLFDHEAIENGGPFEAKFPMPFSDLTSLPPEKLANLQEQEDPLEFGHSLEDQIGGQLDAGFALAKTYDDNWDDEATLLNRFGSFYLATLAIKTSIS